MRNLFQFILKNSSWLVALFLIAISFYLVFSHNTYQRSVYLTSANNVAGKFYSVSNKVTSFFHLRHNNFLLLQKQAELEEELHILKTQIADQMQDSVNVGAFIEKEEAISQFKFLPAEVVNISFSGPNNFITINKGSNHGVKPDMGVVSHSGIVGVVHMVSDRYSTVIPIINPKFRLSAKIKDSENTGSVSWDGKDINIAQIGELPKHEVFNKGDTVVTSFSRIFPKDIVIGYIVDEVHSKDDNFILLNMKIATNFHSLMGVLIIDDIYTEEINQLENSTN